MIHRPLVSLPVLAAILLPASVAIAAPDWVARVIRSPIGGHQMGNPAAPTKLVEYVSYTCTHCAAFVKEATGPLKTGHVRGGKVSVEVRNAVRDKYDLAAALIARCGGPARFMANHEALFANQPAWIERIIAYDGSPAPKPAGETAALQDIGRKTGLYLLMAGRGFTEKQLDACVADPASMRAVLAMTDEAWKQVKISGTPGFTINGKLVEGSTWGAVRAALPAAPR